MQDFAINGLDYLKMIQNGANSLSSDYERINSLNVFPVPDGDTGTNMLLTIQGGASVESDDIDISKISKQMARSMVLSARGNSGVILSQFFKGVSMALANLQTVDVRGFAEAMKSGAKKAYSVVSNPTEGTILTVMREAGDFSFNDLNSNTTLEDYLECYLKHAKVSLAKTPELLPVLKKAGVIDSGGAGFILILEGMLKALRGEFIDTEKANNVKTNMVNTSSFNADSELTYGYCTEFILQLQNSKVDTKNFDLNVINTFLEGIGDSIVSFKDEDLVKVHVHTFDPGAVLTECRKYGEFITLKIENMNVQHSENDMSVPQPEVIKEHKKYAIVAVASGEGIENSFTEMGVDVVVAGGQTMNTSTSDFIEAFNKLDAENILVYPNNSNILLAARMAADTYDEANVYVVPTRTIAEGYSAISMLNFDSDNITEILDEQAQIIDNVGTLEVTYSIRDAVINDIKINKDDYICIYNGELVSSSVNRLDAIKEALKSIPNLDDKQVFTVLCGQDVDDLEFDELVGYVEGLNSFIEVCKIEGKQDIYSYIIGIE